MKSNAAPFDDIRVRQAMQLAINLDEVHSAYLGLDGDVQLSGLWNPVGTEWSTVDTWDQDLKIPTAITPRRPRSR